MNRDSDPTERSSVEQAWFKLLQDVEIGKKYWLPSQLVGLPGPVPSNPILEQMIASRLYIALASLLDDFLEGLRQRRSLNFPEGTKPDLNGRIEVLRHELEDPDELHNIRKRRNQLAHQSEVSGDWGILDNGLGTFHSELIKCGWDTDRPDYQFYGEKSRARNSADQGVLLEFDISFGIKLNDEWVIKMETKQTIRKSGN